MAAETSEGSYTAFDGAAIGSSLGIATGAHLGNGMRGYYFADLAVPVGCLALSYAVSRNAGWALLGVPIQLAAAVAIERSTGRTRARRRPLHLSVAPDGRGGVALGATIRF